MISLPASDAEAETRYQQWKTSDPFPQIPPALLNSADIMDYVATTGMIYPFHTKEEKLKSASYEVDLLGTIVFWDEQGEQVEKQICRGDTFVLRRNSIAFVQVEPVFRIPDYIALRFNLKILHVHRGILLGTGPLVDPGFVGNLYIPLHNLTDSDYTFKGGEGLIWMEFTKVSWPPPASQEPPASGSLPRGGNYVPFPRHKLEGKTIKDYLSRANPHRPIRSSIPVEIREARQSAQEAKRTSVRLTTAGIVALLAIAVAVAALTYQILSFVNDVKRDLHEDRVGLSQELNQVKTTLRELEKRLAELEVSITKSGAKEIKTATKRASR
jgi:deoxycytidine triphosphate deaminase